MALVDHPAVGVAIDPSHATYAGEDVAEIALSAGRARQARPSARRRRQEHHGRAGRRHGRFCRLAPRLGDRLQRAAVIELEYEHAMAPEVRPDLARAKTFLEDAFAAAELPSPRPSPIAMGEGLGVRILGEGPGDGAGADTVVWA